MRIFVSAGEPSGDVHGANLIRALQQVHAEVDCVGFGGDRMARVGCKNLHPLANHAVMGLVRVLAGLPRFLKLISQADRYFRHQRPDAVVLIDCPGFNWWIARRAHYHRIPVFYFVPPQLWAWAGWRVSKMRRFVDHVLCALPFEEAWYRERNVPAEYVGHPFFDEVPAQTLDPAFLDAQRRQGGTVIGLLPGSRSQEVQRNFPTQLKTAEMIHRAHPEARFLVASYREGQRKMAEQMCRAFPDVPIELHVGKTPEIMEASKACLAVSGSVSLELLHRVKPTVIVYRTSKLLETFIRPLLTTKYITLVNLLAGKMLYPEFCSERCQAEDAARALLHWLDDEHAFAQVRQELAALRDRTAQPGACARAAQRIVEVVEAKMRRVTKPLAA